jgi:hypothetical protein
MVWPLNRPVRWLGAASALESTSRLAQNNSLPNYRADLLQEPEKKTYPETSISDVSKRLFAGGIAGAIAKTAIAPLDRVKIIFQTHPSKVFSLANVVKELVLSPMPFRNPPCVWVCLIFSHNLALLFPLQAKPILLLPNLCNPCFKPICCRVYKGLACPTSNVAVRHWRIMMYVCACAHAQIKNCPSPNTRLYPSHASSNPTKNTTGAR